MRILDIFRNKKEELPEAQRKWNKMWDMWTDGNAESPYAELMTYQSEVNNGGHDQYFFNTGNAGDLEKEMSALKQLLPAILNANLEKAYQAYLVLEENDAAEETLSQCDDVFYENEAEINRILETYAANITL